MQINLFTLQNGSSISTKLQYTGTYKDPGYDQIEFLSWVKELQKSGHIQVLIAALLYNTTEVEYHPLRNLENVVQIANNGNVQRNIDLRQRDDFITGEQAKELGLFDLDDLSVIFLKDHTVFIFPGDESIHNILDFHTPEELEEIEEERYRAFKFQFEHGLWINSTNVDLLVQLLNAMEEHGEEIRRVHRPVNPVNSDISDLDSIVEIAKQKPIFVQLNSIETEDWDGYPETEYSLFVVELPDVL